MRRINRNEWNVSCCWIGPSVKEGEVLGRIDILGLRVKSDEEGRRVRCMQMQRFLSFSAQIQEKPKSTKGLY